MADFSALPSIDQTGMDAGTQVLVVTSALPSGNRTTTAALANLIFGGPSGPLGTAPFLLVDSTAQSSLDWDSRQVYDALQVISIDWHSRQLWDSNIQISANWDVRQLYDANGGSSTALDWQNRHLVGSDGMTVMLDWSDPTILVTGNAIALNNQSWTGVVQTGIALPTADPADGNGTLWMDPITRAVFVGT